MPVDIKKDQALILQELEQYKKNNTIAKPLFESIKEVSAWLLTKEK